MRFDQHDDYDTDDMRELRMERRFKQRMDARYRAHPHPQDPDCPEQEDEDDSSAANQNKLR